MSETRVAVVTGASSGNGRAIAIRLASDGFAVVCSDLRPEARAEGYERDLATPTHEAIERAGGSARFVAADASKLGDMSEVIDRHLDQDASERLRCRVRSELATTLGAQGRAVPIDERPRRRHVHAPPEPKREVIGRSVRDQASPSGR